jgi:hypothetical protein
MDVGQDLWARLAAAGRLPADLGTQEIAACYDYLRLPETGDDTACEVEHAIRNDLLNALRRQTNPPAGLEALLGEISRDQIQHAVMRAYGIQHLQVWYAHLINDKPPVSLTESDWAAMRRSFWDALDDSDPGVSRTALLALHRLAEVDPDSDSPQVSVAALKFAQDDGCPPLARSTALQVCAGRKLEQALLYVLELAQAEDNIPLRISAIAALGTLGGPDQVGFLEQLATGENERLRPAARTALRRLDKSLDD